METKDTKLGRTKHLEGHPLRDLLAEFTPSCCEGSPTEEQGVKNVVQKKKV